MRSLAMGRSRRKRCWKRVPHRERTRWSEQLRRLCFLSSKSGDPRSLLENNARVVEVWRAGRFALDHHFGARPHRQPWAAAAALLVAHYVAPFSAVHVAVAIGKRGHNLVYREVMTGTDQMPDLVCNRVGHCRAFMMHDSKGLLRIGVHACGQAAALRIIDDQYRHIGAILVAQAVNLIHVAVALIREAPDVVEMCAFLNVVGEVGLNQPKLNVAETTEAEGLVALLDGKLGQLAPNV